MRLARLPYITSLSFLEKNNSQKKLINKNNNKQTKENKLFQSQNTKQNMSWIVNLSSLFLACSLYVSVWKSFKYWGLFPTRPERVVFGNSDTAIGWLLDSDWPWRVTGSRHVPCCSHTTGTTASCCSDTAGATAALSVCLDGDAFWLLPCSTKRSVRLKLRVNALLL